MKARYINKGFTLVELVTVVVLVGVLAALGGFMILTPITSFTDQARRSELTDIADNALQRISRELRNALPNSVRVNSPDFNALEFLHTSTGGRYRAHTESGGGGNPLVNGNTDTFDVLDGVDPSVTIDASGPSGQANCLNNTTDCLVLYNTGIGAGFFNAYNGDNIAAITAATATTLTYNNGGGFLFPFPIPPSGQQRFFVVDTPVSYVCSGGQLWRYQDYSITVAQPTPAGGAAIGGVNPRLLADNIASCIFSYNSGAGSRHGLVTLRITVTDAPSGESVSLLYQTHVSNVP
jgi:MSHA biogenesis protein MshO